MAATAGTAGAKATSKDTSPADVFNAYLKAFSSGDMETAYGLLSEDFAFDGPVLKTSDKAAFVEGSKFLAPMADGYRMLKQFTDGRDVCSVYEFKLKTPKASGSVLMMEWNRVSRGKLASAKLVFDTAAFASLMPS